MLSSVHGESVFPSGWMIILWIQVDNPAGAQNDPSESDRASKYSKRQSFPLASLRIALFPPLKRRVDLIDFY
jgi:hypothetical protein